jgi:hypothetical protein
MPDYVVAIAMIVTMRWQRLNGRKLDFFAMVTLQRLLLSPPMRVRLKDLNSNIQCSFPALKTLLQFLI